MKKSVLADCVCMGPFGQAPFACSIAPFKPRRQRELNDSKPFLMEGGASEIVPQHQL